MKKLIAFLIIIISLVSVINTQAQTFANNTQSTSNVVETQTIEVEKTKSLVVQTETVLPEVGKNLLSAGRNYTYAKLLPLAGGIVGYVLISNGGSPETGYIVSGISGLAAIYCAFKGDANLRNAGKKLKLYTGSNGAGVALGIK
jgi:hypothetical protein